MDMISTIKGTLFEQLYPAGWDLERLKYCVTREADTICDRQDFWHKDFQPEPVEDLQSMAVQFGHEIAMQRISADFAGRADGNVSLDGLFFKGMEYFL